MHAYVHAYMAHFNGELVSIRICSHCSYAGDTQCRQTDQINVLSYIRILIQILRHIIRVTITNIGRGGLETLSVQ